MKEVDLNVTPVFHANMYHPARIKINQGGTSSSKTYSILQAIFFKLTDSPQVATVIGQDIPNLKKGAMRDLEERILAESPWMRMYLTGPMNKAERTYRFKNGSILEFTSFSDAVDARSGKRDIAFFNEANGIPFPIYEQVAMRTTGEIFIDYNPSEAFWVHERIMTDPNSTTIFSNYKHNPYCHPSVIDYLLSLKDKDPESWRVYGLGKTGAVAELVFPKFEIVESMPEYVKKEGIGADYGYRADPTAFVHCGLLNENDIYVDELIYGYKMTGQDIYDTFPQSYARLPVWPDPADPRVNDELADKGLKIRVVKKGPDSVRYGLNLLSQYKLHVTERSLNLISELKKYKYIVDKNGKVTNEPVDAWNHAIDALRYWAMMNLQFRRKRRGVSIIN